MEESFIEFGCSSLNKFGEEICGDVIRCIYDGSDVTLILADGLGSGVKANVLANRTCGALLSMMSKKNPIEECVCKVIRSMPFDEERGVSYSTFSVIHADSSGDGFIYAYDNPQVVYYHNGVCKDFTRIEHAVDDQKFYETRFSLHDEDVLVLFSDGAVHAGVGMILSFGWQRPNIMSYLQENIVPGMSAQNIACMLARACNELYFEKPGDDTSVVVLRKRKGLRVNVMVGPSVDPEGDSQWVNRFLSQPGKKVICGGTTSQIVSRHMGKPLITCMDFPDKDIPPVGSIKGIDLVTEGVFTLRRLVSLSEKYMNVNNLGPKTFEKGDGASLLAKLLLEESSEVVFFVGQCINSAYRELQMDTTMKMRMIEKLTENLKTIGKKVTIYYN